MSSQQLQLLQCVDLDLAAQINCSTFSVKKTKKTIAALGNIAQLLGLS